MTFKKPNHAGLVALAFGLLFTLLLSMFVIDRSHAEGATAAPTAAAQSAPPACAGNADPPSPAGLTRGSIVSLEFKRHFS